MAWPKFTDPYVGIKPAPGVRIPEREELLNSICKEPTPRTSFAYPPEAPTCWIKYGRAVYWNEVCAQVVAYDSLRQLGSSVRAPGVFYAFEEYFVTYIVMEYIPGKTAGQCLKESQDEAAKEVIYRSIALALSELHRIPIPESRLRPAAVSGGGIRHSVFDELRAPRHYENVQQLEDHINAVSYHPTVIYIFYQWSNKACIVPRINQADGSSPRSCSRAHGFLPVGSIP